MTKKADWDHGHSIVAGALSWLRGRAFTGLIIVLPIRALAWICLTAIQWVDSLVLAWVPFQLQPAQILSRPLGSEHNLRVPGLGVVAFLIGTTIVGSLAKALAGRTIIGATEKAVARTPVVRSVYTAAKQIAKTVVAEGRASFERVCMIEYPRRGVWVLGLVSAPAKGELMSRVPGQSTIIAVFMITTPNPTAGFLLLVEEDDAQHLDMLIEAGAAA